MSTEKKQMNEWLKITIESVIRGIVIGLVITVLKKIGVI